MVLSIPPSILHALLWGFLVMIRNGGTAWIRLQDSKQAPNCGPYLSSSFFTVSLQTLLDYGRGTSSASVMTCHVYCKSSITFMHQQMTKWLTLASSSFAHSFYVLSVTFPISSSLCLWEIGLQSSTITSLLSSLTMILQ